MNELRAAAAARGSSFLADGGRRALLVYRASVPSIRLEALVARTSRVAVMRSSALISQHRFVEPWGAKSRPSCSVSCAVLVYGLDGTKNAIFGRSKSHADWDTFGIAYLNDIGTAAGPHLTDLHGRPTRGFGASPTGFEQFRRAEGLDFWPQFALSVVA